MLARVVITKLPADVRETTVDRWHRSVGDAIEFGDPICDLHVSHYYRKLRRGNANRLGQDPRHDKEVVALEGDIRIRVCSADRGLLRRVLAPEGSEVREGTQIAIASTEPDESLDGDGDYDFRLVCDVQPGTSAETEHGL